MKVAITRRPAAASAAILEQAGLTSVLARIYAARGVKTAAELDHSLAALPPFDTLRGIDAAAERLCAAIERGERILIVADYDADGATACAVGVRGLRLLGGSVDFIVPNRFAYGYGLKPEIVFPSHGNPIVGAANVQRTLTQYRDAILYVHDATVAGMNEGKDVYSLMKSVKLPPALEVGEGYGAVAWSVRGIYEGYAGWFDGDPATMYATSPADADAELARLAGGAGPIAARAEALVASDPALALRLTSAAVAIDPKNRAVFTARRHALEKLLAASKNSNESGWLHAGLGKVDAALK